MNKTDVSFILLIFLLAACGAPTLPPSPQGDLRLSVDGGEPLTQLDIDFGQLPVGQSRELTVVASNLGRDPLLITHTQLEGAQSGVFFLRGVPVALAPGVSSSFVISFTPSAAMPFEARLSLLHDGFTRVATAHLQGKGTP
ncbi:MAG: choice-of-anchor D domain-containing protein [Myxococcota bacterium]